VSARRTSGIIAKAITIRPPVSQKKTHLKPLRMSECSRGGPTQGEPVPDLSEDAESPRGIEARAQGTVQPNHGRRNSE
jgi:hypothetical protein